MICKELIVPVGRKNSYDSQQAVATSIFTGFGKGDSNSHGWLEEFKTSGKSMIAHVQNNKQPGIRKGGWRHDWISESSS